MRAQMAHYGRDVHRYSIPHLEMELLLTKVNASSRSRVWLIMPQWYCYIEERRSGLRDVLGRRRFRVGEHQYGLLRLLAEAPFLVRRCFLPGNVLNDGAFDLPFLDVGRNALEAILLP